MAEGRFLSKNIAFSEQLGQVSMEADYLFMRMIPHLDSEGRISGSPKSLRARVCPLRGDLTDESVAVALAELDQARLIIWYEVDGLQCVEFPNFAKYQVGLRKEREAAAKVPSSSALGSTRVRTNSAINTRVAEDSGVTPQNAGVDRDNSKLSKVKLSKDSSSPAAPEDVGVIPDPWPKSWAHDTSQRFLTHGVVIPTGTCGTHAKPLRDQLPFDEWLRVVDRMATSPDLGFGLPALLRKLPEFRDKPPVKYISGLDEAAVMEACGIKL